MAAMTKLPISFRPKRASRFSKWDAGDYDACAAGLKQGETKLGPISVIVNNAGITRDAMLRRMTPHRVDLDSVS